MILLPFSSSVKQYPQLEKVKEDIAFLEGYFSEELGPKTLEEKEHQILTSKIADGLEKDKSLTDLIVRAAKLRRSLG